MEEAALSLMEGPATLGGLRRTTHVCLGTIARSRGNREVAWGVVGRVLPQGLETKPGDWYFAETLFAQTLAAGLALDAGDLDTAKTWLEAHDRWLAWSGAVLGQSEGQALWAQYHQQAGAVDKARDHAERALAHATEPRQPLALLAAHRLMGELDTDSSRFDAATRHLAASLALADACAAPFERALTRLAHAALHAAKRDNDAARTALDEVRTICTPLGAKPTLARADALAERLTTQVPAAVPAAPVYPAGLSAREVEVLRLVAAGLTNAHVAEQLYLSPRTVEQHLRSIYGKLGVTTRTAATHFAFTHDLA